MAAGITQNQESIMKKLIRIYKELQLFSRFAARKLGIPSYQIHQIYLPEQKLIYIPIPKNACTTIKHALYEIEFARIFDAKRPQNDPYLNIHDYYNKRANAFSSVNELKDASECTRVAIVRDPIERLLSCYRNRVVDLGDLKADLATLNKMNLTAEPDLNTFVLNLKKYRKACNSIEHHSRPQSAFLGGTLKYLDYAFPIEEIDKLHEILLKLSPGLEMQNFKSRGTGIDLSNFSQKALHYAVRFYKKDYALLSKFYSPVKIQ